MRPSVVYALTFAYLGLAGASAAIAAPPGQTVLYLCGPATLVAGIPAGNSPVLKSGPADVSSGNTHETDCSDSDNGDYTWSLDHATSQVSPGNGKQHGTEHGTWTVVLDDGTATSGIYNGRITSEDCANATQDGPCFSSSGRINSTSDDANGDDSGDESPVPHWVGRYTTTITATGCGDENGCEHSQETVLTYRVVGSND